MNTPGWAVEIHGEQIDVNDLRAVLIPGFDPWIENYEDKVLIRSKQFANLVEAGEVAASAGLLLRMLHGAVLLEQSDARAVSVGEIFKFGSGGTREQIAIKGAANIEMASARARGYATVLRADGTREKPRESKTQKRLRAAVTSTAKADLLVHLARSDNWYDLYKAMEIVRGLKGGERQLIAALAQDWVQWDRVWKEANHHRHAASVGPTTRPASPPSFNDAFSFVLQTIARLF
jgi:hypothetical protein